VVTSDAVTPVNATEGFPLSTLFSIRLAPGGMGKVPIPPPTVIVLDVLDAGGPDTETPVLAVEVAVGALDAAVLAAAAPVAAEVEAGGALVVGDWATVLMPPEHAASESPATQASAVSVVTRYTFMWVFLPLVVRFL
jgi:hypothetical protein